MNSECSETTPEMHAAIVSSYGTDFAVTSSQKLIATTTIPKVSTTPVTAAE